MLADDIQACVGGGFDQASRGGVRDLAQDIFGAQRFSLGPDACAAMAQVSAGKLSSVVKALEVSRAPFSSCWFEWCPRDWGLTQDNGLPEPSRVGAFLKCSDDSGTRFVCTVAWVHRGHAGGFGDKIDLSVCPWGFTVDLNEPARSNIPRYDADRFTQSFPAGSEGRDAARKLYSHFVPSVSPYMGEMINFINAHRTEERAREMLERSLYDILWEAPRILTALAFINSRNVTRTEAHEFATLNKKRVRAGKLPLLSYSEVNIALSLRERVRSEHLGLSREAIRRHLVRGHFKVRQRGVYWWRPFLRGSAEVGQVIKSGYIVGQKTTKDPEASQ